ncbi:MAG: Mov34/MPN/PAD-1 family protein [Acidimicrobiales bacterium]
MLYLSARQREAMIATCVRALPDEGCGLLIGRGERVEDVVASPNVAASARVYEIDSRVLLATDRRCEREDLELMGVFHSHTHSQAYPSPTDVAQAPDPAWHYVLLSLRDATTVVRSYRIVGERVDEEEVVIEGAGGDPVTATTRRLA